MGAAQNYVSVSRRPPDVEDYIDMLRRHRSWVMAPMYVGMVVAVVVAFLWPDTYQSSAVMRITPQTVPEQMVPSVVNLQLAQRLQSLQTLILSRSNLTALITNEKFNLYQKTRQNYTLEDAIAEMQKAVRIVPLEISAGPDRNSFAAAFQISFSYSDRYKAQAVVQDLVRQFMNENVTVQTNSARTTQGFISDELKTAQETLDKLQTDIAQFRIENQGRLPEQAAANGQVLSSMQLQLSQINDRLSRAQQSKNSLETTLQNRIDMQNLLIQGLDDSLGSGSPASVVKSQGLINLANDIRALEMQLAALRELYTDEWPPVREVKAKLVVLRRQQEQEQVKQQAAETEATSVPAQPGTLSLQERATMESIKGDIANIKTQIQNTELEVADIGREKLDVTSQIQQLRARIDASPLVEQKYTELSRDLGLALAHYDDLKKREQMSTTAKNLEERGAGERLEVLDPASLPQTPSDPNRWAITGMGAGIGFVMGLVLAGAKEAKDTSLKNLKDVRAYTNLPVLSSIPLLENALLIRRKRRLFWLAWSTTIIVGSLAMFAAMSYYYSPHTQ